MYSSFWWDHVNVHELEIPMRHTDPEFAELIHAQGAANSRALGVLGQCAISPEEIPGIMQNGDLTVLCVFRKEVSKYNEAALVAKFNMPLIHAVHSAGSGANCPELSDWFNDREANMLLSVLR